MPGFRISSGTRFACAAAFVFLMGAPTFLQEKPAPVPAHPKVDQVKVDEAIRKGCEYLIASKAWVGTLPHGQRNQPQAIQSYAEMVLLTLLHSGFYEEDNPQLKEAIDLVTNKEIASTYTASLMAMALQKLNARKFQWRIAQCAQFLVDNQCDNGQWDYGEPIRDEQSAPTATNGGAGARADVATARGNGSRATSTAPRKAPGKTTALPRVMVTRRRNGPPSGDNSNSQYAALGIRACLDAGIVIEPKVLQRARQWWESTQNGDGGWGYTPDGDPGTPEGVGTESYGSMTVGAVGALCIYDHFLGTNYKTDPAVVRGMDWLARNFDVARNPKKASFAWFYYLYGLERVGMLYGTEIFGTHEWYPEGAEQLLNAKLQWPNGKWESKDAFPNLPSTDTCFAILFLRRGTVPLRAVATGGGTRR